MEKAVLTSPSPKQLPPLRLPLCPLHSPLGALACEEASGPPKLKKQGVYPLGECHTGQLVYAMEGASEHLEAVIVRVLLL